MPSDARAAMIDAAIRILAEDGYQATSFTEVLARSGAPRGSIYHHFPGGKDELIAAALDVQIARTFDRLGTLSGQDPVIVVQAFLDGWRRGLELTDFAVGCSLLAVTTSAGPGELRAKAGVLFRDWRALLARLLRDGGADPASAAALAAQLLAATEGAVAISRAERSFEAYDLVAAQLLRDAATLTADRRAAD
ncbi:TetR/AcrR family transcriptional regulator [Microbacterium capsulatum]|uniref:TetR/AcrR family transcriptional regulator n=1 Tax=Microbacterium capsulatum TaxID=3041921 RepID=A0ABU0XBU3_9MICO|nr:TetR/AcrR family transcriptional regulator [Microbacterium sp. ASV81]MDQ4212575.1 TetR/AcrR family transcriptional regulator [Microbacterium sp. ASV81]